VLRVMHRGYFPQLASQGPGCACRYKGRVSVCVCRSLGTSMPVERLYIYRFGATNACAITGEKDDPRLPTPLAHDRWQFWMQTSRHQIEDGLYGFGLETAVTQIAARGYYLFTGSIKLLDARVAAQSPTPLEPIPFGRLSSKSKPHSPSNKGAR
jgi:hypothetical protein